MQYGASADQPPLDQVVAEAELDRVIGGLPEGLGTRLGEGGGLVSGGEGQRVRLGRALTRPRARLVVLDEPFRGLERPARARLLAQARARWQGTTLLCATHDVAETAAFDRVLVIEGGRIVEDGRPADLADDPDSCYRALLDGEAQAQALLFRGAGWRRWRMDCGRVSSPPPP